MVYDSEPQLYNNKNMPQYIQALGWLLARFEDRFALTPFKQYFSSYNSSNLGTVVSTPGESNLMLKQQ